jgi:hypothetical protein
MPESGVKRRSIVLPHSAEIADVWPKFVSDSLPIADSFRPWSYQKRGSSDELSPFQGCFWRFCLDMIS